VLLYFLYLVIKASSIFVYVFESKFYIVQCGWTCNPCMWSTKLFFVAKLVIPTFGWKNMHFLIRQILQYLHSHTITKCILVHYGFHYILNEFWHFYLVKLFNLLVNGDQLLRTMNCETKLLSNEIQIYQAIHLLVN
jgi:hypothetical protein